MGMVGRVVWGVALLVGAVACDSGQPAPLPSASPSGTAAGCARPAVATSEVVLRPAPTQGVPKAPTAGEPLVIDTAVLDWECRPAGGARMRIWHTDARGLYGPKGGDDCCYHEARGEADDSGRFRLETIRPARYPEANAPPAHIHFEIDHGGLRAEITVIFGLNSPPATVPLASGPVTVPLRRDGDGWRGEAVLVVT